MSRMQKYEYEWKIISNFANTIWRNRSYRKNTKDAMEKKTKKIQNQYLI